MASEPGEGEEVEGRSDLTNRFVLYLNQHSFKQSNMYVVNNNSLVPIRAPFPESIVSLRCKRKKKRKENKKKRNEKIYKRNEKIIKDLRSRQKACAKW